MIPGGGTGHPGAEDAARQFLIAAGNLAAAGFATTFVGPAQDAGGAESRLTEPCASRVRRRVAAGRAGRAHARRTARHRERRLHLVAGDRLRRPAWPPRLRAISASASAPARPPASPWRRRRTPPTSKRRRFREDEPARAALARRAAALKLADGVDVALDALGERSVAQAGLGPMPNIVLLGYDLDQPSFRHRMRSLVRPLEVAGWAVRTERFPSGRYGLRTWERRALARWADVVVLHQIKLSAIEARLFAALQPAASIRRGRCHLRAQAPPPRRAGGRVAVAAQEVRGDVPRRRCGGGGQRGARRALRAKRRPRSRYCRPRSTARPISRALQAARAR